MTEDARSLLARIVAEAFADQRVFVTKDHDIGALVFRDGAPHAGVLLIDDLGSVMEETALLRSSLHSYGDALTGGAFLPVNATGARIGRG